MMYWTIDIESRTAKATPRKPRGDLASFIRAATLHEERIYWNAERMPIRPSLPLYFIRETMECVPAAPLP